MSADVVAVDSPVVEAEDVVSGFVVGASVVVETDAVV